MRKGLVLLAALVACFCAAPGQTRAAVCGLPDASPWWIDFADSTVPFRSQFAEPGEIVATTNGTLAPAFEAGGAQTVYWQMHLEHYVGTPTAPAPPDGIASAADEQIDQAANAVGCGTPVIAVNEMAGVGAATLSPTATVYRQDVLAFVQDLASRGAQPYLLLPASPNPAGDAAYWAELGAAAHLVREVYPPAPATMAHGAFAASRTLRLDYSTAVQKLVALGVPASQTGIMLGFQSGGTGGRAGLQPLSQWLEFVKLATLAANEVAGEQQVGDVWVWGWGVYSAAGADGDKPTAACVELWTRNPSLCNAPALASFDTDLTEGQLPEPVQLAG